MQDKCIVFGSNNKPSKAEGISLHPIPFEGADEPQKQKRRKHWVDFVKSKCAHWEPTKYSAVCSKHIQEEDYEVMFPGLTNGKMKLAFVFARRSKRLVFRAEVNQKASELRER